MHVNSLALLIEYGIPLIPAHGRVLEIAPDSGRAAKRAVLELVPVVWEEYTDAPTCSYPLSDDSYDTVLSLNVAEHVPTVWDWMREQARLCKPGGHVITICPATRRYHEDPVDCWRIYPQGAIALHQFAGLTTVLALSRSYREDGVVDTIMAGRK